MSKLHKITIEGYKSIKKLDQFELKNLNILIGANGAGKSNFISVFKFLANIFNQNLQSYVAKSGGPDVLLYHGRKTTDTITMKFEFGNNAYGIRLIPTDDNRLIFQSEEIFTDDYKNPDGHKIIGAGHSESNLKETEKAVANYIRPAIRSWKVYHFHDTSDNAKVKQIHQVNDNLVLKGDASNLAAYLRRLKNEYEVNYNQIVNTIQLVAPFFGGFIYRDDIENIQLEWYEQGDPDTPFKAHMLSDGTLRFICLATLLLQPFELMSDTILIDEPELGLHPYAINVLSELIKRVAEQKQLIISSQSVELINCFEVEDIIVTNREKGATTFERLDIKKLEVWLDEYSLGDLWKQNIIGGRPSR